MQSALLKCTEAHGYLINLELKKSRWFSLQWNCKQISLPLSFHLPGLDDLIEQKAKPLWGEGGGGRGHKCNKTNNDDRYPRILEHDSSENPVINTNIIVEAKISENKIACCCIVVLRPR